MIAVFALPLLLSGCALEGEHSASYKVKNLDKCGEGGTWVNVRYGDSQLKVKSKIKVQKGSGIEFRLKPDKKQSDPVDYENVKVTISGKTKDENGNPITKNNWINVAGNAKDDGTLAVCADVDIGDYEYLVEVEGVGTLDPRVNVHP
jgi:hypothetical protein